MTGGEIRIPRAPGSPGKKSRGKGKIKCMAGAEAKRRHVAWWFQIDYFNSHSLLVGADVMHPEVWTF